MAKRLNATSSEKTDPRAWFEIVSSLPDLALAKIREVLGEESALKLAGNKVSIAYVVDDGTAMIEGLVKQSNVLAGATLILIEEH